MKQTQTIYVFECPHHHWKVTVDCQELDDFTQCVEVSAHRHITDEQVFNVTKCYKAPVGECSARVIVEQVAKDYYLGDSSNVVETSQEEKS